MEILISIVVLALGMLGLASLLPSAAKSAACAEQRIKSAQHAREVLAAVLAGAQDVHLRWERHEQGRDLRGAFFFLPHPAAAPPEGAPGPTAPEVFGLEVFGRRDLILLPLGSDKVFVFPRADEAREVAARNGDGAVVSALDDRPQLDLSEASQRPVYLLDAPPAGVDRLATSFALAVQRRRVHGVARDGLYAVTILVFRTTAANSPAVRHELVAQVTADVAAGPSEVAPAGTCLPPGADPARDWAPQALARRAALLQGKQP